MNKAKLKTYAPQARKDFIAAVTQRANLLGLSESAGKFEALPAERRGDVVLIAGREWPASVAQQRDRLVRRIQRDGFGFTCEAVAYTWFNRFAALRYMELHDYLGHGHRVLSSATAGGLPDILAHAADLATSRELPGLNAAHIAELKLAGNKDGELYRLLLVAQCNALSAAMPFLFERIDDETELLLPDNLLRTDSVIAKLVAEIPEEDWAEVEIIGWLYQFYISEKKDQIIGKVVKSEDIPAATQLFTPNWIVQYLVQNSVGRLWLMANPASTLKAEWPYYIEPAEQTPEVNAQLDALIQTRMAEDGGSLNPESITVLDPACGSGHILVEAYALLKGIYLERGYRLRDIPRLILEKNLYGLDIDDRAAQLAGFALLMKARADDRRLFNDPPRLNVLSLQESKGLELDELATHLAPFGVQRATVKALLDTFEYAKTFGSLIQIPDALNAQLPVLADALGKANETGDLYAQAAAQDLMALVEQAKVLGRKFDAVVANPPYMGRKYLNPTLKGFAASCYECCQADIYAMFIERNMAFCEAGNHVAMICMDSWLSGEDFQEMRRQFVEQGTFVSVCHLGPHAFPEISGEKVQVASFVASVGTTSSYRCIFFDLVDKRDSSSKEQALLKGDGRFTVAVSDFADVPRGVFTAYRASQHVLSVFADSIPLRDIAEAFTGLQTGDNERFIRYWFELPFQSVEFQPGSLVCSQGSSKKWFPYVKGSDYRKWYGNQLCVVDWEDDGKAIRNHLSARPQNADKYFRQGIAYNNIAKRFSARHVDSGFIFDQKNSMFFADSSENLLLTLGLLHSDAVEPFLRIISPKDFGPGALKIMPVPRALMHSREVSGTVTRLIEQHREDWNSYEESWGFQTFPLLDATLGSGSPLEVRYFTWIKENREAIDEIKRLEEQNNRLFIDAYGLAGDISSEVPAEQITLTVNPAYRYGANLTDSEQWAKFRQDTMAELVSYAIGCMMGRYSLDEPGLIYAHAGNVGFDPTRYQTFPADADGIVPITDEFWFEDDAAHRVREFLRAVWDADTLDENMAWLAESLGTKAGETPDETIRRYLADKFFKDHLQTYKKRPIYWLFSSGKQGAFQALVYLHRYHEGTLARLRAEYVVPLTGKMQARIEMLEKDATAASSTAARNKLNKQIEKLRKKHVELLAYDEKLRHYADMRISLDLDDGVKVNYGKFGDLLAEVKAVTGGTGEE
ncbi:MAG: BREX-1 system adenine-specific DNA-methyltransferase PglX [Thauera sp.]